MGKFNKGILGGFTGKVGNIIGSKWKGITYMRSLSERSGYEPTEKQIIHRAKFAYASKFLQPLHPVLKVGFRTQSNKKSPQNAAMSELMTNAIEGEYPSLNINFDKLRMAKGSLIVGNKYQVILNTDSIDFTWSDSEQTLKDHGSNFAVMVAIAEGYYPTYSLDEFTRDSGAGSIVLPEAPSGSTIYCYLAFAHQERNMEVSNSKLVGTVRIP